LKGHKFDALNSALFFVIFVSACFAARHTAAWIEPDSTQHSKTNPAERRFPYHFPFQYG
jgi:hypothetical protein